MEAHAELAYADVMLFTAVCTVLHDDMSLLSFINAALSVKSSYNSYQTSYAIVNQKTNWDSEFARMNHESGARMAIGTFDLMISFIPNKLSKLLEFVGFSGDRQFGLHELMMSESLTEGSRWPVSAMILGGYNLFFEVAYGLGEPDLQLVADIARKMETKFPSVSSARVAQLMTHALSRLTSRFHPVLRRWLQCGFFKSARAIYEATIGDFEKGLRLFQESNESNAVPEFKFANHLFMSLIYM